MDTGQSRLPFRGCDAADCVMKRHHTNGGDHRAVADGVPDGWSDAKRARPLLTVAPPTTPALLPRPPTAYVRAADGSGAVAASTSVPASAPAATTDRSQRFARGTFVRYVLSWLGQGSVVGARGGRCRAVAIAYDSSSGL